MNPSVQAASAAPAPWRSRWYSAAKRFGLTAVASFVLAVLGLYVETGKVVFVSLLMIATVWGVVRPAPYDERPTVWSRIGVAVLGAFGLLWLALLVAAFLAGDTTFQW